MRPPSASLCSAPSPRGGRIKKAFPLSLPLAGKVASEARRVGPAFHLKQNRINHAIQIRIDVNIPEPHHTKTARQQIPVTPEITRFAFGHSVLRAINFKDQSMTELGKVNNVPVKRHLPTKMKSLGIELLQMNPKFHFFMRHRFAKFARFGAKKCWLRHMRTLIERKN